MINNTSGFPLNWNLPLASVSLFNSELSLSKSFLCLGCTYLYMKLTMTMDQIREPHCISFK